MTLREYLNEQQISRAELSARIGTSPGYLAHILNGHRRPSIKLSEKIIAATGGDVSIEDLRPDISLLMGKYHIDII